MKCVAYRIIALIGTLLAVQLAAYASNLDVGSPAPEFELPDQDGQLHSLEDYRDQWVVLYFYPKDETPGCTTEACEFRDNIFAFRKLNAQILGVSLDDVESHKKFAENHGLPFPMRSLMPSSPMITTCRSRCLPIPKARQQTSMASRRK